MWPHFKQPLLAVALLVGLPAMAAPMTYTYTGPGLRASTDHLVVSFTTAAPLPPNTSFLSQAAAGVTASNVKVLSGSGVQVLNFNLPVTTFQVHTNASGAIDAWYIFGGFTSMNMPPPMIGIDRQAYTMNTMTFIPGSEIPGSVGLVLHPINYDQATDIQFYSSCAVAPPSCAVGGSGQSTTFSYSGIINPANSSAASWTMAGTPVPPPPPPPPAPVSISGSLPGGVVGSAYVAKLSASGGTPPYVWSATNLPPGLSLNAGTLAGTPTAAGSFAIGATATDATGTVGAAGFTVNVVNASCSGSNATITSLGRDFLVVNGGLSLGDHVWYTPTPAGTSFTGGTTAFVVGEVIDWNGTMDPAAGCYASTMTVKPAASLSCSRPSAAKRAAGKAVVTATGANFIVAGGKRIDYAACTNTEYGGRATAPAVGDRVEWQGYVEPNGNVMASQLTFN